MGIARLGLGGREGLDKLIWTAVMVMMCSHCVCTTAATLDLSNIDVSTLGFAKHRRLGLGISPLHVIGEKGGKQSEQDRNRRKEGTGNADTAGEIEPRRRFVRDPHYQCRDQIEDNEGNKDDSHSAGTQPQIEHCAKAPCAGVHLKQASLLQSEDLREDHVESAGQQDRAGQRQHPGQQ